MGKVLWEEGIRELEGHGIPVYSFPELAVEGLAAAVRYGAMRARPEGAHVRVASRRDEAAAILQAASAQGRRTLSYMEARDLLDGYGIPLAPARVVASPAEAIAFGREAGFPIVLKGLSPRIVHKTDFKAVKLDLRDGDAVARAWKELRQALDAVDRDAVVMAQRMITEGREVILGAFRDPQFGAVAMFGLGGIYVEVLRDVAYRVLPITDRDAAEMVRSIRGYPLLAGVRGEAAVDLSFLEQTLLRLSQLMMEQEAIDALDINPLIVSAPGVASLAVDARIGLRAP
jgi:acetyltransferase